MYIVIVAFAKEFNPISHYTVYYAQIRIVIITMRQF